MYLCDNSNNIICFFSQLFHLLTDAISNNTRQNGLNNLISANVFVNRRIFMYFINAFIWTSDKIILIFAIPLYLILIFIHFYFAIFHLISQETMSTTNNKWRR